MGYWILSLPLILLVFTTFIVSFIHEQSEELHDPQEIVASICTNQYAITTDVEMVMVLLERENTYKMLRLSTYRGTINPNTRIMLVKYEEDTNSYKVEAYE